MQIRVGRMQAEFKWNRAQADWMQSESKRMPDAGGVPPVLQTVSKRTQVVFE